MRPTNFGTCLNPKQHKHLQLLRSSKDSQVFIVQVNVSNGSASVGNQLVVGCKYVLLAVYFQYSKENYSLFESSLTIGNVKPGVLICGDLPSVSQISYTNKRAVTFLISTPCTARSNCQTNSSRLTDRNKIGTA